MKRGYVLAMWTGLFENERTGRPILFGTVASALRHVERCPSWGRSAVSIHECAVRPNGRGGLPDYIIGASVGNG